MGKGGINAFGTLAALSIFGCIAAAGLGLFLQESGDINPVVIIIALVIGLVVLSNFVSALSSTRVVLDANQRSATRTDTLFFLSTGRQEMAFNVIRDVQVTRPQNAASLTLDSSPIWQVQLQATDGSTLLVNDRGARAEMETLAQKVGALMNRPVRGESETKNPSETTGYTPASVMNSLFENLAAFAQSASVNAAPTISAFPDDSPRMRQERVEQNAADAAYARASERLEAEQVAANASLLESNARMASEQTSAFASDVRIQSQLGSEQVAAGAPFVTASARLAQQQATADAVMGYSLPPLLTMPQIPALPSFAPVLNLPSFPPFGAPFDMLTPIQVAEIKEVEAQISPSPNARRERGDTGTLLAQARQMMASRNFSGAQEAFVRALSTNPADAAVQNDLGVVYYAQNKWQDAERAFRRAVALDPFSIESRYNLGLALQRMGRRADAQEQFRVGAQNAGREGSNHFLEALRGVLHEPLTSPQS